MQRMPAMRAEHDVLGKHVLAHLLDGEGDVEVEKVVAPADALQIDVYFTPDPARRLTRRDDFACMRLIRRMITTLCMFELFSTTPSFDVVRFNLRKQLSLDFERVRQARRAKRRRPERPVQWILSPGQPREALHRLEIRPAPGWPPGFYEAAPGFELWVIVLSELPANQRETLPLRLLGTGRTRLDALREIRAVPADDPERPALLALLGWIRYVIRENRKAAQRLEKESEFMYALREGFEAWKKKELAADLKREVALEVARQRPKLQQAANRAASKAASKAVSKAAQQARLEGEARGKAESLLKFLAARGIAVSAKLRAQIRKCSDAALLDRWIERAAVAESASELLSAN